METGVNKLKAGDRFRWKETWGTTYIMEVLVLNEEEYLVLDGTSLNGEPHVGTKRRCSEWNFLGPNWVKL